MMGLHLEDWHHPKEHSSNMYIMYPSLLIKTRISPPEEHTHSPR